MPYFFAHADSFMPDPEMNTYRYQCLPIIVNSFYGRASSDCDQAIRSAAGQSTEMSKTAAGGVPDGSSAIASFEAIEGATSLL
jgi:hypothetical protein